MSLARVGLCWAAAFLSASIALTQPNTGAQAPGPEADDPPGRVARLAYMAGTVSFKPAGTDEWAPATLNYPFKTNDQLWTDGDARAELSAGNVTIRVAPGTSIGLLGLDDRATHVMIQQGSAIVRVWRLGEGRWVEVDSPNSSVTLMKPGLYRIGFDGPANTTKLVVRGSEAEVLAAGSTFRVEAQQQARVTGNVDANLSYDVTEAAPVDDFDQWSSQRDARVTSAPADHVSRDMIGYEDLADNGTWTVAPDYGAIWRPTVVVAGWAPYRYGRWAWVAPWGWTWIDDASWGFAPFHYGRWAFYAGAWGWVPGPVVARPWYAPALVGFAAAGAWSVSFGVGGGFGWFPLGPAEPFVPFYRAGPGYLSRVNVSVTNVNVTNVAYVNRGVPGAFTAVSRETVVLARPVGPAAVAVPSAAVASATVTGSAPAVAPRAESVFARPASTAPVARPAAPIASRVVVTRRAAAPPAVPFRAQQTALAARPGYPVGAATLASLRREGTASSTHLARPAGGVTGGTLVPARPGLPQAQTYAVANASGHAHTGGQNNPHGKTATAAHSSDNKGGKGGHATSAKKPAAKPKEPSKPKHSQ